MDDRVCVICGRNFKPIRWNQEDCGNDECRREHRNQSRREHYKKSKEPKDIVYCQICGKSFVPGIRRTYCSDECAKEAERQRLARRNKNKPKKVKVIEPIKCIECGKTFYPKTHGQKCCSDKCSAERAKRRARAAYMDDARSKIESMTVEEIERLGMPQRKPIYDGMKFTMNHLERLQGMLCISYGKLDEMRNRGTLYAFCVEKGIKEI